MYHKLSMLQRGILEKTGKFVVRACPGSGKTYCTAAKVSRLLDEHDYRHKGLAVISFTNVAWKEIEQKCKEDFGKNLNYPHFLGTIDSFINQNVFLPFGHLKMGCNKRPILVGEPYGVWSHKYFSASLFDNISYDINGELFALDKRKMIAGWEQKQEIGEAKRRLTKAGYATQSDANYFSMKVLDDPNYRMILTSLAERFEWLIIDEAQDTSEIQMKIIDMLIDSGIKNVMMVGDPDQAIFVWNNAKPELFEKKYACWKENSIELNESYRSSRLICEVVQSLSSPSKPKLVPAHNNDAKDCEYKPEIWLYNEENKKHLIERFIEKCETAGISTKSSKGKYNRAVIFRSYSILISEEDNFKLSPWVKSDPNYTRDFMKGKYLYDTQRISEGLRYLERAIVKYKGKDANIDQRAIDEFIFSNGGIVKFRKALHNLIHRMPSANLTLGEWITAANRTVPTDKLNIEFKINPKANGFSFTKAFPAESMEVTEASCWMSTVHKVKGETYEAVLLFLSEKAARVDYGRIIQIIEGNIPATYKATTIEACKEEARIVYVALSRPRRLLFIALPNAGSKKLWEAKLGLQPLEAQIDQIVTTPIGESDVTQIIREFADEKGQ